MKQCHNCGAQIADDSRFCAKCGKEIPQSTVCPHCGASVGESDAFCQNCGKSLNEKPSSEPITYEEEQPKSRFKKYLPYIIGAVVVLAIIGYFNSNDSNSSSSPNDKEVQTTDSVAEIVEEKTLNSGADYTEEDIKNTLEAMYKQILYAADTVNYDSKYTSAEYQSILNKAYAVAVDEVVLDADHWIQGQDCDKPSMSVVSVKKESDTKAIAEVKIKLFQGDDYQSRVRLVLLFENGKWVVDDFISFGDGGEEYSEKAYLKKYIEDCQSKPKEDYSWLQGHWVYEQGNYKGHFIIQGDKITQYSSMNPERETSTFRIEGDEILSRIANGVNLAVKIDFANHTIDYGDGNWMHKVE